MKFKLDTILVPQGTGAFLLRDPFFPVLVHQRHLKGSTEFLSRAELVA